MTTKPLGKKCSKCKLKKSLTDFSCDKSKKDGLQCKCKYCDRQYRQDHKKEIADYKKQYNQEHREEISTWMKQYKQEHKTEIMSLGQRYYQDNKIAIVERVKEYRQNHKTEKNEWDKKYSQTPKGKDVRGKASRKHRALKINTTIEDFSSNEIFERDSYTCQLCGKKTRPDFKNQYHPLRPELDHIIPLSKGGEHSKLNTQCLCHLCNIRKGNSGKGDQLRMF